MLNDCGDVFDDDDTDDCMAAPSLLGVQINAILDQCLAATDPAPKPAPVAAASAPSGDTLPGVRALADHLEREKAQASEAPKRTGLESVIRFAGGTPAPAPERQPAPEATGLASVFRFAGDAKPEAPDDDASKGLASVIRFR